MVVMEQMAAELRSLKPWTLSNMVFLGQESRKGLARWFGLRLGHEVTVIPCLTETFRLPAHSHGCQEASVPYHVPPERAYTVALAFSRGNDLRERLRPSWMQRSFLPNFRGGHAIPSPFC